MLENNSALVIHNISFHFISWLILGPVLYADSLAPLSSYINSHSPPSSRQKTPLLGNLVLGQRREPEVGLDDPEVREQLLGLLVGDAGVDDDVVTGNPVDRGGDLVLVAGLERVDDAEHLGGVAAGRGGVGEDGADGLLGVDDEDGADGEGDALGVDVGGVLVVKPSCRVSCSPR